MTFKSVFCAGGVLSILLTAGCIPLTVGSTAKPVPVGTTTNSTSFYVVPNSLTILSTGAHIRAMGSIRK